MNRKSFLKLLPLFSLAATIPKRTPPNDLTNPFTLSLFQPGPLSIDYPFSWIAPFDCHVRHVSAVVSDQSTPAIFYLSTYSQESNYTQGKPILFGKAPGLQNIPTIYTPSDYHEANPTGKILENEKLYVFFDHYFATSHNLAIILTLTKT